MSDPVSSAGPAYGVDAFGVDDQGVTLPPGFEGSVDVHFDDHHAWSFSAPEVGDPDEPVHVAWPKRMLGWLDGESRVRLVQGEGELWSGEVTLGSGEGRVVFLDRQGIPVMIDKWGLLQRPFSGRGRGVVEQMVDITEQILAVMREECGLEAWIAFGTLLGAAREGKVIGHDSDIDLAYLSRRETPAEMVQELHDVARALRGSGLKVADKSGSFITVLFAAPDGAQGSIDVYTCFHVGELLYETATVRSPVPAEAIEPLTTLSFEGRDLPAPADPDRMLTVSYGPSWRVPDPSFSHEPGPEITERFNQWFGSLMRHRRDWETFLKEHAAEQPDDDFVAWVCSQTAPDQRVVEVGCGTGRDAVAVARAGRRVLALDYARLRRLDIRAARRDGVSVSYAQLNLYDLRDVLTRTALVARDGESERVVVARELVECLAPDGLDAFWQLCSTTCRVGGRLLLEGVAMSRADLAARRAEVGGGRVWRIDPHQVARRAERAGGRVQWRDGFDEAVAALRGRRNPARWRMVVQWPAGRDAEQRPDTGRTGRG